MFFSLSGKIFSHLQKALVSSFPFFNTLFKTFKFYAFFLLIPRWLVIIVTYETASHGTH